MEKIIVTSPDELRRIIGNVIDEKFPKEDVVEKTYSINQVAKLLGRSHKKITDLVMQGILKVTPDNRIFESSIRAYNNQ